MPRQKKVNIANETAPKAPKKLKELKTLRGMKDILPSEQKYWDLIRNKANELSKIYNFGRIDTPILEEQDLFIRSLGKDTDVVEKELFSFLDRGKDKVVLRPESTAAVARAYIIHGMANMPQPIKVYNMGPMFRHEKPQSGRLRQFHQMSFEVLGESGPAVDAQLILIGYNILKEIGIDVSVQINSIGCSECRNIYKEALVNYYRQYRSKVCEDCKKRMKKNPMRLLDCKEKKCQAVKEDAPQIVDYLCDTCKGHFFSVLEYLDDLEIPYNLDSTLVRGLDYYNRTVFEFYAASEEIGRQNALGGGGRYDLLVELLGGKETPACGFSLGMERVILALKSKNIEIAEDKKPDIFIAQIGDQARRRAMVLFEELRKKGINVIENFAKDSLKAQLEMANKLKIPYVLILGQKEVLDGTVLLRDMEGGIQETISLKKAADELIKKWLK